MVKAGSPAHHHLGQVHDPRLGLLELKAKLGQDRRERLQPPPGFLPCWRMTSRSSALGAFIARSSEAWAVQFVEVDCVGLVGEATIARSP